MLLPWCKRGLIVFINAEHYIANWIFVLFDLFLCFMTMTLTCNAARHIPLVIPAWKLKQDYSLLIIKKYRCRVEEIKDIYSFKPTAETHWGVTKMIKPH